MTLTRSHLALLLLWPALACGDKDDTDTEEADADADTDTDTDTDSDADTDADTDTDTGPECEREDVFIEKMAVPSCNEFGSWEVEMSIAGWSNGGVIYVRETGSNSWGEQHSLTAYNDRDECVSNGDSTIAVAKKSDDVRDGTTWIGCDTETVTWWIELYNSFSSIADCVVIGHDPTYDDVPKDGPDPYGVPGGCRTLD